MIISSYEWARTRFTFFPVGFSTHMLEDRVPLRPYLSNRLTGDCPPPRFPYCLHCKNAANSAPQKLIRISHSEPCNIQMMRIAVTQNVMAVSDFCDIALAPFSGRR